MCCNQFVNIVAFVIPAFQQIPKDILLEVLGPSKVFKQVIMKVINSAVAEYVEKVLVIDFISTSEFDICLLMLHLKFS